MIRGKKAQDICGISFGVIFSIIIIIAIIGVAFFAINHFLNLNKCTKIGFFYDDIKDEVNRAWVRSDQYRDVLKLDLPTSGLLRTGIQQVCFGNTTQSVLPVVAYQQAQQRIKDYHGTTSANVFIEPPEKACDGTLAKSKIEHVFIPNFFCVAPVNGKIEISLKKEPIESLVKLEKA